MRASHRRDGVTARPSWCLPLHRPAAEHQNGHDRLVTRPPRGPNPSRRLELAGGLSMATTCSDRRTSRQTFPTGRSSSNATAQSSRATSLTRIAGRIPLVASARAMRACPGSVGDLRVGRARASASARSAPASLLHPWKAVATGALSPSMQGETSVVEWRRRSLAAPIA